MDKKGKIKKDSIKEKWQKPRSSLGYSSLSNFLRNSNFKNRTEVKSVLSSLRAYSLHKGPVRKKFTRRPVMVTDPFDTIGIDIGVMDKFKNNQKKKSAYFLVAIDVFSLYIWARPMKKKDAQSVCTAMKSIFDSMKKIPRYIWGDQDQSFLAKQTTSLFNEYGVKFYSTSSVIKSSYAEIGVRKIKSKLYIHMTATNKKNWENVLEDVVRSINSSKIPILGMSPLEARKEENHDIVFHRKFHRVVSSPDPVQSLTPGTFVRISKKKISLGMKNYTVNWSEEIFMIEKTERKGPVFVYYLIDTQQPSEKIKGSFYAEELNPVPAVELES